ncbi:hypothetical protein HDZ31DRAFT_46358 [Schizophyllum fasciatum]
MLERQYASTDLAALSDALLSQIETRRVDDGLRFVACLWVLRGMQSELSPLNFGSISAVICDLPSTAINPALLKVELGRALSAVSRRRTLAEDAATSITAFLHWLASQPSQPLTVLSAITLDDLSRLYDLLAGSLPAEQSGLLESVRTKITVDEDETLLPPTFPLPDTLTITPEELENARRPQTPPSTPKRKGNTPDILGPIISPPTALLRSPAATGLTKTYAKNDFRHLRQLSASMQNTSRMPSTHVDDFGSQNPSPMMLSVPIPGMPDAGNYGMQQ